MTCGIYALMFNDYEPFYIGQSINIEKRYKEHLYSFIRKDCNEKMLYAYTHFGDPECVIVEECAQDNLDSRELYWIKKLDVVNTGLNMTEGPVEVLRGEKHPNAKYSNDQIMRVAELLIQVPLISYRNIAELTGVKKTTIENIVCKGSHSWVWSATNIPFSKIQELKNIRKTESLTAERRGKVYPPILSPEGIEYTNIPNLKEFSNKFGLNHSHLCGVLNGKVKSHKGWKLKESAG